MSKSWERSLELLFGLKGMVVLAAQARIPLWGGAKVPVLYEQAI